MKKVLIIVAVIALFVIVVFYGATRLNLSSTKRGEVVDSLNGVYVYHNGGVGQSSGRNTSADGYNIGIKYQCVEFVKRYYYEYYNHKMPDSYGHAKDFFNRELGSGEMNIQRDLVQYKNGGGTAPQVGDLVVFKPYILNHYGHVAIVSNVTDSEIEIIQQNYGLGGSSRERFELNGSSVKHRRLLGWLRKNVD